MLYYLFRHYAQTKFHSNLIGSRFFCVDLTWNDPNLNLPPLTCYTIYCYCALMMHCVRWRQVIHFFYVVSSEMLSISEGFPFLFKKLYKGFYVCTCTLVDFTTCNKICPAVKYLLYNVSMCIESQTFTSHLYSMKLQKVYYWNLQFKYNFA